MTRHDNVRIGARSCPELPSLILYLRAATCNSQNVHSNGRAFHVNATSALCATRLKVTHWLRRACAGSQPCNKGHLCSADTCAHGDLGQPARMTPSVGFIPWHKTAPPGLVTMTVRIQHRQVRPRQDTVKDDMDLCRSCCSDSATAYIHTWRLQLCPISNLGLQTDMAHFFPGVIKDVHEQSMVA